MDNRQKVGRTTKYRYKKPVIFFIYTWWYKWDFIGIEMGKWDNRKINPEVIPQLSQSIFGLNLLV